MLKENLLGRPLPIRLVPKVNLDIKDVIIQGRIYYGNWCIFISPVNPQYLLLEQTAPTSAVSIRASLQSEVFFRIHITLCN